MLKLITTQFLFGSFSYFMFLKLVQLHNSNGLFGESKCESLMLNNETFSSNFDCHIVNGNFFKLQVNHYVKTSLSGCVFFPPRYKSINR